MREFRSEKIEDRKIGTGFCLAENFFFYLLSSNYYLLTSRK